MEKFFNPRSVAVIGASSKKGKIGYEILKNVIESGVKVYPVNPNREEILGKKCYKSLIDVDGEIDLAVIAVEAKECIEVIEECGRKNIKNVVVISGGFKESGNFFLEEKLREKAKKYGVRIIGPNCIGVFNGKNNFNTFFQRNMDLPDFGNVAILTQSGTFGIALLEGFANENIGVSKFVSYGNKADVDEVELIKYLQDDMETKIIAMYVEEIGRKFFEGNFTKPIVILKSGRGKLGQRAAQLHTGAMATNYEIFKGACKQKNVIFADDFEEFFGIIKIIAMRGIPKGNKLSVITNGAGPSVLACDFMEDAKYIELKEDIIDLTGSATAADYINAIEKNDADILLLTFVFQDAPLTESFEKLYEWLEKNSRFYISLALGGKFVEEQRKKLAKLKIPSFEEPRVLINSLNKILEYSMRK
ncbi:MAG TPA: CoA-binding protein [Thermoplasmatales archaeon]|nr:CoA-binding protein [Thermoplasmatales archaeon]